VNERLIGVLHLPALPGSPRAKTIEQCCEFVCADARALASAGFRAAIIENFGDAPFFKDRVPPVTVAAMTRLADCVRREHPQLALIINVLRNDACSALAIAATVGASAIRVNILSGARLTDQGIIEGQAAVLLRLRRELAADHIAIMADVDVKHSAPLAPVDLSQETHDVIDRGGASAVVVSGSGTGRGVDLAKLQIVKRAAGPVPVYIGSGATIDTLPILAKEADGIIVGSAIREGGKAGAPVVLAQARAFVLAWGQR
jgi:membrane complex biogenesis BtpA family protein